VNQGPTNQAYLVNMLVAFAGGPDAIRRVTVRFLGNVFAGERVECRGRVSEVDRDAGLVTVELEETADGRPVMAGSAVVALPA
jgi:acyl dehydratase